MDFSPNTSENVLPVRRSSRRKNMTIFEEVKPKKPKTEELTEKQLEKLYTKQKIGRPPNTTLETIFEDPKQTSDNDVILMSNRKYQRSINFDSNFYPVKSKIPNQLKCKVKKRRDKAKDYLKKMKKSSKVSMDLLMKTLSTLDELEDNNENGIDRIVTDETENMNVDSSEDHLKV